jgi:hypothetical protein
MTMLGITHHSTFLCFNGACAEFSQQLSISVMGITQHIKSNGCFRHKQHA